MIENKQFKIKSRWKNFHSKSSVQCKTDPYAICVSSKAFQVFEVEGIFLLVKKNNFNDAKHFSSPDISATSRCHFYHFSPYIVLQLAQHPSRLISLTRRTVESLAQFNSNIVKLFCTFVSRCEHYFGFCQLLSQHYYCYFICSACRSNFRWLFLYSSLSLNLFIYLFTFSSFFLIMFQILKNDCLAIANREEIALFVVVYVKNWNLMLC